MVDSIYPEATTSKFRSICSKTCTTACPMSSDARPLPSAGTPAVPPDGGPPPSSPDPHPPTSQFYCNNVVVLIDVVDSSSEGGVPPYSLDTSTPGDGKSDPKSDDVPLCVRLWVPPL